MRKLKNIGGHSHYVNANDKKANLWHSYNNVWEGKALNEVAFKALSVKKCRILVNQARIDYYKRK